MKWAPVRVEPASAGDDPVRRQIDERSGGPTEALRQQWQVVTPMVAPEVVDEQVRRRDDCGEEPESERQNGEWSDDDEGKDRQRRAHQETDEKDGRHLDAAECTNGSAGCQRGVLLEFLGG